MRWDWDAEKARGNEEKHGVNFEESENFDFPNARVWEDKRKDYGETRELALGMIRDRLHLMVFVAKPDHFRIISLRKANRREGRVYERRR